MGYLASSLILLALLQPPAPQPKLSERSATLHPTAQSPRGGDPALQPQVLITTLPPERVIGETITAPLEHDTEVSRGEAITIVVTIESCEKGAQGACDASADLAVYRADGSKHSEVKNLSLKSRRATAPLKLADSDATGLSTVVATVRDPAARRVGKAERIFGVK
jgi:hypothetical protein